MVYIFGPTFSSKLLHGYCFAALAYLEACMHGSARISARNRMVSVPMIMYSIKHAYCIKCHRITSCG